MKLLVVDDHALFREGLRLLLANISPGVEIHEAGSVAEAVALCRSHEFRMVLLDLALGESSGLGTLDSFRAGVGEVPVIVLSGSHETRVIRVSIERGAVGFIPKTYTSDLMINALRFVLGGGVYLPPCVLQDEVATPGSALTSPEHANAVFERLSPRQKQVASMLLQGASNKVMARKLDISEGTVKAHVSAVFQIIGAHSRVEAVLTAARLGLRVF